MDIHELRSAVKGQVVAEEAALAAVSSDFGRLKVRTPWAILRPSRPEDIVAALAFARKHKIPVSTRAQAHTQTGQALHEGDLFDSVRSGLGQFGIITKAKVRLRPFKPNVRVFYLLYDDLGKFMKDAVTLMSEPRLDHLESWCVPAPMGFKTLASGEKQAFAQWFYNQRVPIINVAYGSQYV